MRNRTLLLDYLAERTGNGNLSDLRVRRETPHLDRIFETIPLENFSTEQWHEAAEYLTESRFPPLPSAALRELLIDWSAARADRFRRF